MEPPLEPIEAGPRPRGPAQQTAKPRRGTLLEVEVERIDERGRVRGRARHETGVYDVHLRRGRPGERLAVEVLRRHKSTLRVRPLEVLRASPDAVEPRCGHFGVCGGCSFQDLAYGAQLREKRAVVEHLLGRAGLLAGSFHAPAPEVEPCVGCDDPWHYRNKMDFTFSALRWVAKEEGPGADASFALGLHPAGQYRKVLDLVSCDIAFREATPLLATARRLALEQGLEPWNLDHKTGLLRHLVLRKGVNTGELLASLVTSDDAPELVQPYVHALVAAHPELTTVVQNVNQRAATVAVGDVEHLLAGPGRIRERLGELFFEISANSFFQTNTEQAERMLTMVRAEAACGPDDRVFDLYCGTGALTLGLAQVRPDSPAPREVVGFELSESAVADARRNAGLNGLAGVRFVAGDVAQAVQDPQLPRPDVVVVDPPRAGLHATVKEALTRLAPRRLVYVSCNLRASALDLAELVGASNGALRLTRVQTLDLFPHTPHVESVLTLVRAPSSP